MADGDIKLVFDTLTTVSEGLVGYHAEIAKEASKHFGADVVDRHGVKVIVIAFTDTPRGRMHTMSSDCHDEDTIARVLLVSRSELMKQGIPS